jgi:hypothetical protein
MSKFSAHGIYTFTEQGETFMADSTYSISEQFKPHAPGAQAPPVVDWSLSKEEMRTIVESPRIGEKLPTKWLHSEITGSPTESPTQTPGKTPWHSPFLKPLQLHAEPDPGRCVLGLWPGEGNKIVYTGKGCEYKIEPMTPLELQIRRLENTPEFRRKREEELLRWHKEIID